MCDSLELFRYRIIQLLVKPSEQQLLSGHVKNVFFEVYDYNVRIDAPYVAGCGSASVLRRSAVVSGSRADSHRGRSYIAFSALLHPLAEVSNCDK